MKASRSRYGVIAFAISLAVLSYIQRVAISQAAERAAGPLPDRSRLVDFHRLDGRGMGRYFSLGRSFLVRSGRSWMRS